MIVKDLLDACNTEKVVAITAKRIDIAEEKRQKLFIVYKDICEKLQKTTPVYSDNIILGYVSKEDGEYFTDVTMFLKEEIEQAFEICPDIENADDIEKLSDEDVTRLLSVHIDLPTSYSFSFSPWAEIVGFELDEDNVQKIGAEKILAAILFEMTFYGFDEEKIEFEKKKLYKLISDVDDQLEKTEDVDKAFQSLDKLFEEIGYIDERSEEEKMRDKNVWHREALHNRVSVYNVLKERNVRGI